MRRQCAFHHAFTVAMRQPDIVVHEPQRASALSLGRVESEVAERDFWPAYPADDAFFVTRPHQSNAPGRI